MLCLYRQLPRFLGKVSRKHNVPRNAILTVAALSLALGLYMNQRADGISLLSSLINFGALTAFLALHVSVVWHYIVRQRSRRWFAHLVMPAIGATILGFIVVNANVAAQRLGFVWIGVGVLVLIGLYIAGRRPELCPSRPARRHAEGSEPWQRRSRTCPRRVTSATRSGAGSRSRTCDPGTC